jgi:ATP-dependent DNA ligase
VDLERITDLSNQFSRSKAEERIDGSPAQSATRAFALASVRRMNRKQNIKIEKSKVRFIEPMLALAVTMLPEASAWSYELKFDDYRCVIDHDRIATLRSRLYEVAHRFSVRDPRRPRLRDSDGLLFMQCGGNPGTQCCH